MAILLEGKPVAEKIRLAITQEVLGFAKKPVLASLMVGANAGAESYVKSQAKIAESVGIEYRFHKLAGDLAQNALVEFIGTLNADKAVNGIIIQLPLPAQIDYRAISRFIMPEKDVEGMHPANIGRMLFGKASIVPCAAASAMELLRSTGTVIYGKEAVIVGHSEIVGKPLALLLLEQLATVTVCHIATSAAGKLEEHVRKADILFVAVGKAGLIKGDWIKEGAIVIDIGINRVDGKIVGDVEFDAAEKKASYITPVPGGVGPLTATMLMRNLVKAAAAQN